MIRRLATPYTRNEVRLLRRQAEHERYVMKLGKKRARSDGGSDGPISFIYKDLDGVQLHHNDALVVTLRPTGGRLRRGKNLGGSGELRRDNVP